MHKIILLGLRDINTDETIKPQTRYGIFLEAERLSEERMDTFSDSETEQYKYKLKISHIEQIMDLGAGKELKIEKGRTPSQKLRFIIENKLGTEEYKYFMNYLMSRIDGLTEDYVESLNN